MVEIKHLDIVLLQVQVMYHYKCRLCTFISSGCVPLYLQVVYHYIFRLCTTKSSGCVPLYLQVVYHSIFRLCTTLSSGCVPLYLQVVYHYIFRLCCCKCRCTSCRESWPVCDTRQTSPDRWCAVRRGSYCTTRGLVAISNHLLCSYRIWHNNNMPCFFSCWPNWIYNTSNKSVILCLGQLLKKLTYYKQKGWPFVCIKILIVHFIYIA